MCCLTPVLELRSTRTLWYVSVLSLTPPRPTFGEGAAGVLCPGLTRTGVDVGDDSTSHDSDNKSVTAKSESRAGNSKIRVRARAVVT